ncbi:MAG: AmmeMemoRadiSam system protein B [Bryobacteraceae bacterium]
MLPRLRPDLDFMPSPVADKPGLLIRDPFHFSDATLIIPPHMVECLTFFDGEQSSLDLRVHLVRLTGGVDVSEIETHLVDTLSEAGFLEDDAFAHRKLHVEQAFAAAPARLAQHAGSGYPDDPAELAQEFDQYLGDADPSAGNVIGIAAPHVSPFGGIESYRAAYRSLTPADAQRTFVVLGTSHYGEPERFGLTRKPFETPLGSTMPAFDLIDELASKGQDAVRMEDYCHAIEHSIEFQVVFLQHLFGPDIRVLPILCGSFLKSVYEGGLPEDTERVARMFGALGEMAAREGSKLCWVLGVDMAHVGQRYGDRFQALADQGVMEDVARRDRDRITCISGGDARGFWERVQEDKDDTKQELKWCGSSPIYTFLKAVPHARGELRNYQQWNIDDASVVSFAGMRFS